uniref:Uncharacterized protein n=1 Tax=Oryza brachyantha TaxID=4533 RepID=J3MYC6_ORYBR
MLHALSCREHAQAFYVVLLPIMHSFTILSCSCRVQSAAAVLKIGRGARLCCLSDHVAMAKKHRSFSEFQSSREYCAATSCLTRGKRRRFRGGEAAPWPVEARGSAEPKQVHVADRCQRGESRSVIRKKKPTPAPHVAPGPTEQ